MIENKQSNIFIIILLTLIILSTGISYYRYMIKEDFSFFTTEESVPNRFDINSYK